MFATLVLAFFAGNTWYVDVNAPAPGNGSQANPYHSIQFALNQATTINGDTLSVAPGVYHENITFQKRVVVEGTAGPLLTILRSATTTGNVVLSLVPDGFVNGSYEAAALAGFTIDGTGNAGGTGAKVDIDDSVLGLRRCIVTGFTSGLGVHQNMSNWIDMYQCTVSGNQNGARSDTFVSGGAITLAGCILRHNSVDAVNSNTSIGYLAYHSCVPSDLIAAGNGSFSGAPGVWNAAARDFHLKPLSPCIDYAGGFGLPLDPDGSQPDVGALTYDPNYAPNPTTYCTPKTNSAGCPLLMSWAGDASLSGPDNFVLSAQPALNNKPGLFIWSRGALASPFSGGTLCLRSPIVRGSQLSTGGNPTGNDCSGMFTWPFTQAYMAQKGIAAGEILYAQAWGRDQGFPAPNNAQLSDAIVFPIGP
jgi:hypothetical protein